MGCYKTSDPVLKGLSSGEGISKNWNLIRVPCDAGHSRAGLGGVSESQSVLADSL